MSNLAERLQHMKRAPSTTPEEQFDRCPDCGSVQVHPKTGKPHGPEAGAGDYWCDNCRSHFDEPVAGGTR